MLYRMCIIKRNSYLLHVKLKSHFFWLPQNNGILCIYPLPEYIDFTFSRLSTTHIGEDEEGGKVSEVGGGGWDKQEEIGIGRWP